jgi:alcohol dehydrogenase class IV
MSTCEFSIPPVVLHGPGALERLGNALEKRLLPGGKALIVTGGTAEREGYDEGVRAILSLCGISSEVFSEVRMEPDDEVVAKGVDLFRASHCDLIIAVGGGSPIDAAKAIGLLVTNGGKLADYMGIEKVNKPCPPLIAIATTAGTGSEVTRFSIIKSSEKKTKMLISSKFLIPAMAVADPRLTHSMSPEVTAATGLDAFCHAVEAFVSKKANPVTDALAIDAIRLISENIRDAFKDGSNKLAREKMMSGALEAGMAFGNSSVALIHGMSRPLGALFHIPHGISNAVLLPVWAQFTHLAEPRKFARIAEAMGKNISRQSESAAAEVAVDLIRLLCNDLGIPSLRDLVQRSSFERSVQKMSSDAIASGSPANNPRSVTEEEIQFLYRKAYM